jgi:hypothetical protein
MLWVWERPEDLRFLNSRRYGVAVLAQTLVLKDDDVIQKPRHHPLLLPPDVKVVAVTRIESPRFNSQRPTLSAPQNARASPTDSQDTRVAERVGSSDRLRRDYF